MGKSIDSLQDRGAPVLQAPEDATKFKSRLQERLGNLVGIENSSGIDKHSIFLLVGLCTAF